MCVFGICVSLLYLYLLFYLVFAFVYSFKTHSMGALLTIFLLKFLVLVHVSLVFVFAFENVFEFLFSRSV